jgi:hypothetical protein
VFWNILVFLSVGFAVGEKMALHSLMNFATMSRSALLFSCLQWLFVLCASSSSRVAIIFRGKHTTYHHFFEEQRRLLVEPLIKNGIIVDVYIITPNSSKWEEMASNYKSLANGVFESHVEKTDHGLDAQHGEEIYQSLTIAANTCHQWQDTTTTSSSTTTNTCWNAIIVWHFAVAPKMSILDFGIDSGNLVLPWREAHGPLPDTEMTETERQIAKSCRAFQSRYNMESRGDRTAHVVFWFDGILFENIQSMFMKQQHASDSDAHFMFQPMIAQGNVVKFAFQGYWESSPKNSNPVNISRDLKKKKSFFIHFFLAFMFLFFLLSSFIFFTCYLFIILPFFFS